MDNILNFSLLQSFYIKILEALPNVLGALGLLLLGIIIAKIVRRLSLILWQKVNIDVLGNRLNEIEIVAKSHLQIKLSNILSGILYYTTLVIFTIAATDMLKMPTISEFLKSIIDYIPKILSAFLILILGLMVSDFLKKVVETTLKSIGIPSAKIIASLVFYFAFINILLSAIAQAGIETSFIESNISILIAGVVVAFAIGYGLASRGLLTNIIASYYNKNIEVGQKVTIENITGEVIDVNKSSVTLKVGNDRVVIPMNKFLTENVTFHDVSSHKD